ncbi:Type 1 glutamine amidotransferase-like domain-containing protein [Cytobacillus suaedae]|nr:Type 1 glutamine amidotransferase-like domain-containing protein [Cytobacillus suaedae]
MGKLFFYSDQVVGSPGNRKLDNLLFAGKRANDIKIGYIPSTVDIEKKYFNVKSDYYREYGVQNIMFFDLYSEFNPQQMDELISCDIIHLSAGNPIEFKEAINKRGMETVLRDYFNNGGTIVGVSGGAVQLGQSSNLFKLFNGVSEDDDSIETLKLVDFEFLPHYNRWDEEFKDKVVNYAVTSDTTVYAGNDGDGLIVEDGVVHTVGDILVMNSKL